ncbi:MAG: hypothetical protein ACI959_002042 [Limisphaerales bacterium]|jgi:hypothetical protein
MRLFLAFFIMSIMACSSPEKQQAINPEPLNIKVYYLGGQSNMEGFGYIRDLPSNYKNNINQAFIYQGNHVSDGDEMGGLGLWQTLTPGHGTGSHSDGNCITFGNRFGPELSFGVKIRQLTEGPIAIIKYARGGTALMRGYGWGNWDTSTTLNNQYDHCLNAIKGAFAQKDVNGDGVKDNLIPAGIIWMQGEADAQHKESAEVYKENLTALIKGLRVSLGNEELPVVIGKIADSGRDETDGKMMDYIEIVHQAQEAFIAEDCCAIYVTNTDNYSFLPDNWHYQSENYLNLGNAFAEAVYELSN